MIKHLIHKHARHFSSDYFSAYASSYSRYRPDYPDELFTYLSSLSKSHSVAWDVATGNGQAAIPLSKYYKSVIATDLSLQQISNARHTDLSTYPIFEHLPAELPKEVIDSHRYLTYENVDLITVAQGIHWFNLDRFYEVVNKILKKDGAIAV